MKKFSKRSLGCMTLTGMMLITGCSDTETAKMLTESENPVLELSETVSLDMGESNSLREIGCDNLSMDSIQETDSLVFESTAVEQLGEAQSISEIEEHGESSVVLIEETNPTEESISVEPVMVTEKDSYNEVYAPVHTNETFDLYDSTFVAVMDELKNMTFPTQMLPYEETFSYPSLMTVSAETNKAIAFLEKEDGMEAYFGSNIEELPASGFVLEQGDQSQASLSFLYTYKAVLTYTSTDAFEQMSVFQVDASGTETLCETLTKEQLLSLRETGEMKDNAKVSTHVEKANEVDGYLVKECFINEGDQLPVKSLISQNNKLFAQIDQSTMNNRMDVIFYDGYGHMLKQGYIENPTGNTCVAKLSEACFQYDANGRLIKEAQGNVVKTYAYETAAKQVPQMEAFLEVAQYFWNLEQALAP